MHALVRGSSLAVISDVRESGGGRPLHTAAAGIESRGPHRVGGAAATSDINPRGRVAASHTVLVRRLTYRVAAAPLTPPRTPSESTPPKPGPSSSRPVGIGRG
jgi:hypothetical protein